jgi:hypothetical protein
MADHHISALLLENPEIAQKTFFIQGTIPDPIFVRRTRAFGKTLFVGIDAFAAALKGLPRPQPLLDVTRLRSFRPLDPNRDKKTVRRPTAGEVFDLLVYGNFNAGRCAESLPSQNYAISRQAKVDDLLEAVSRNRSVVVDSRLGNGKTVFLHLASFALAAAGYRCFLFRGSGPDLDRAIALLREIPKAVILFVQYTAAQDVLRLLEHDLPDAKFIVEMRKPAIAAPTPPRAKRSAKAPVTANNRNSESSRAMSYQSCER